MISSYCYATHYIDTLIPGNPSNVALARKFDLDTVLRGPAGVVTGSHHRSCVYWAEATTNSKSDAWARVFGAGRR